MARYTITHKCGHTATVNICGPTKDRDRKAAWYAEHDCTECRRAKENADAAAKAEAADRPELAGSEKQIAWATTIRESAIDSISKKPADAQETVALVIYNRLREELNHNDEMVQARGAEIASKLGEDKQAAIVAMLLDAVNQVTDAKEWIDNRQFIVGYMANIVAVKLIGNDVNDTPETLQEDQFGSCKNGSYFVKTIGWAESTDQKVKTPLAFLKAADVTDNGNGTITVKRCVLQAALDVAADRAAREYGTFIDLHIAHSKNNK